MVSLFDDTLILDRTGGNADQSDLLNTSVKYFIARSAISPRDSFPCISYANGLIRQILSSSKPIFSLVVRVIVEFDFVFVALLRFGKKSFLCYRNVETQCKIRAKENAYHSKAPSIPHQCQSTHGAFHFLLQTPP